MNTTPSTKEFDVAVVGGGAAGLMAAGQCAKAGLTTLLCEKNPVCGRKLSITGKGRCNVTNNCTVQELLDNIPTNPKFLYNSFGKFSSRDTMDFFESRGVELKTERGRRVFPASDKAADIVNALVNFCHSNGVAIENSAVTAITKPDIFVLSLNNGKKTVKARNVIICTGGASYRATGSTGDGYRFASGFGHTIVEPAPSLVPLESDDTLCRDCMGLTLKNISLSFTSNGKKLFEEQGELLFTHFGITGPLVLSASAHIKAFPVKASIDLKPALDMQQLDKRLLSDFGKELNKEYKNSLSALLPQKLIAPFIAKTGIAPYKKVNSITKQERAAICAALKGLELNITGKRPINEAVITSGGVKCSEINPGTMESKLVDGLFFAGEVIDVDAYTGGYNLQIAFSTAVTAATAISEHGH